MGWLAVAYVVLATQYALNGATLPVNELANPLATALISIGIASFNCGTMYYLASPDNPKRGQLALGKPISIAFARGRHRRGTLSTVVLPPLCNWLVRRGEGGV